VGVVTRVGCFDREVHIELNPWLMERHYISFDEVVASILTRNVRTSGGSFNSYVDQQSIVTLAKFTSPLDVERVILRSNFELQRVTLGQVARVRMREKDERLVVRSNGEQGISLVINKKLSADVIRVVDAVKGYMDRQQLPAGVRHTFINDLSTRTRARIDILRDNGVIGFVLVTLILLVFLNLRTALWTAFGIPFSLLGAFLFLPLTGQIINIITLGGILIVIGMLLDDAIVVAEHIESYKEAGMDPEAAAIRAPTR
jgi:multidrug efflux pump subunit AcrB